MSTYEKEMKIIKLNDERRNLINKLKNHEKDEYAKEYEKRLEQINREIESLIEK